MNSRPQPELSHLDKKTLAHFQPSTLEYNFVIQDQSGFRLPLHLRYTSPAKVHASPSNSEVLKLQVQDPDLIIYAHSVQQTSGLTT